MGSWQQPTMFTQTSHHMPYFGHNDLTHCGLLLPYGDGIPVNIGCFNGFLLHSTKPLSEALWSYYQQGALTFIKGQSHEKQHTNMLKYIQKKFQNFIQLSQLQMSSMINNDK